MLFYSSSKWLHQETTGILAIMNALIVQNTRHKCDRETRMIADKISSNSPTIAITSLKASHKKNG